MALPASDNFNRTSVNPIGGNWTTLNGFTAMQIVSNTFAAGSGAGGTDNGALWNADIFNSDQWSEITWQAWSNANGSGPVCRGSSSANTGYYCVVWFNGTIWQLDIQKWTAGTYADLGNVTISAPTIGDRYRMEAIGTDISMYLNDVLVHTWSDIGGLTGGSAGIYSGGSSDTINAWSGGNTPYSAGAPLIDAVSNTDSGFTTGHPFASGAATDYTIQTGHELANGTYYWRARAIDPSGSNGYGAWSSIRSFTVSVSAGTSIAAVTGHVALTGKTASLSTPLSVSAVVGHAHLAGHVSSNIAPVNYPIAIESDAGNYPEHYDGGQKHIIRSGSTVIVLVVRDGTQDTYRSTDNGATWTQIDTDGSFSGCLLQDSTYAYHFYRDNSNGIYMVKFAFNAGTIPSPTLIYSHALPTATEAYGAKYESVTATIDSAGRIFIAFHYDNNSSTSDSMCCLVSDAGQTTWTPYLVRQGSGGQNAENYTDPSIQTGCDNTVYLTYSTLSDRQYMSRLAMSTNQGVTWVDQAIVDGDIIYNTHILPDPQNANIIYVFAQWSGTQGLSFIKSLNKGSTWSAWTSIDSNATSTSHYADPTAAVTSNGDIYVAYRSSSIPVSPGTNYYQRWARSTDGGATWDFPFFYHSADPMVTKSSLRYQTFFNGGGPLEGVWMQWVGSNTPQYYNQMPSISLYDLSAMAPPIATVVGHASLAGKIASIVLAVIVSANIGHVAISGHVSSVGSGHTIAAVAGHGTLTGKASAVTQSQGLTAITGHGVITGKIASINQSEGFTAVVGHVATTVHVTAISQSGGITATVGHTLLTGKAAALLQTNGVTAVTGHGTVTGYIPAVQQPHSINGIVGHGILTGYMPGITQASGIIAATGHTALTGGVATIIQPRDIAAIAGHVALNGAIPAILQPYGISAVSGRINSNGKVCTIVQPQEVLAMLGHSALSGYVSSVIQASADVENTINAVVGHLAFIGKNTIIFHQSSVFLPGNIFKLDTEFRIQILKFEQRRISLNIS